MNTRKLALLLAVLFAAGIWGCGSNLDSGGNTTGEGTNLGTDPVTGLAYVGAATCIGCHEGFSWSAAAVANFLEGKHVIHSSHNNAQSGAGCLVCHDPIGDGPGLQALPTLGAILDAETQQLGLAAIGCENCHGAGGQHYGVGPIPDATPDFNACGKCHNADMDHNAYHPEGDNIVEDYMASPHANSGDRGEAVCARCHTDEGGRLYRDVNSVSRLQAVVMPVENPSPIQCRTCHDAHNPNKLLLGEVEDHGTVTASAEFATCTSCHQRPDAQFAFDALGNPVVTQLDGSTSTDGASGDLIYHATRYNRIIAASHYDDPATPDFIEGYVIDPTNERACRDCHNVHAADTTINRQWARSGHGGGILDAKEATNPTKDIAGVLAYKEAGAAAADNAFPHYDWDSTTKLDTVATSSTFGTVINDRGACQMCHTATGNMNFQNDPAGYDITGINNDFSHLVGWVADDPATTTVNEGLSSGQNELLYCWSCHKNNSGALRGSGAVTLKSYTYGGNPVTLPDLGNSNICLNCHGGRNNVENIIADARSSRFAGHHGTAAGTLFSEYTHIAYEYDVDSNPLTNDYANKSFFRHAKIGTVDVDGNEVYPGTGTAGPCVGCHMGGSDHTFSVVTNDAITGGIAAINNVDLCNTCHAGMAAAVLEEEKLGFEDAIAMLGDYLNDSTAGTYSNYLNLDISTTSNNNYKTVDLNAYGSFQNYKYLDDEPGAYTHNRYYAKRLIFDSIDWLDNGTLNGVINIDAANYPEAAIWLKAAAVDDPGAFPPVAKGDAKRP